MFVGFVTNIRYGLITGYDKLPILRTVSATPHCARANFCLHLRKPGYQIENHHFIEETNNTNNCPVLACLKGGTKQRMMTMRMKTMMMMTRTAMIMMMTIVMMTMTMMRTMMMKIRMMI